MAPPLALPLERTVGPLTPGEPDRRERAAEAVHDAVHGPPRPPGPSDATTDYYRVTMEPVTAEIIPGYQTPIWGYNGYVPGPTFDVQQGRKTVVRQVNNLPAPHPTLGYTPFTSVHLHGSASLPQYDGYASDVTYPGQCKDYRYPNFQDARTLWYHDHGVHHTASNVFMGLAGMYRMHDALEQSLPIPQGRLRRAADRQRHHVRQPRASCCSTTTTTPGVFGDVILVNGRPWPVMKVERRKYRFRILNASVPGPTAGRSTAATRWWSSAPTAGLMPAPAAGASFRHGNAERYEVDHRLREVPAGPACRAAQHQPEEQRRLHQHRQGDGLRRRGTPSPRTTRSPACSTRTAPSWRWPRPTAITTRTMALVRKNGQWTINGQTWADVEASAFSRPSPAHARRRGGLGDPQLVRRLAPPAAHPPHRLQDPEPQRQPALPHERGAKDVVYLGENERSRYHRFGPGGAST